MSTTAIYFSTPTRKVNERSTMVVVAKFRDRATNLDVTPTNVSYRLDGPCGQITGPTSVTTGMSISITIPTLSNQILNDTRVLEPRTLTVIADLGLSTEFRDSLNYEIRNRPYYS